MEIAFSEPKPLLFNSIQLYLSLNFCFTSRNLFVNKLKLQVGLEYFLQIMLEIFRHKCIFSLYILIFFFFILVPTF